MDPKSHLAERVARIKPSPTLAVAQRARELKAAGIDVLSFSVGEPDFPTPAHVCEAAAEAVRNGATRYTAVDGIAELKQAILDDSARRRGGHRHAMNEVMVSVGAKHTLFNLAMALFEPGDEVVIPAPYWVSYPAQVRVFGAKPVVISSGAAESFRISSRDLREAMTSKTKAVVLCSPSNPTGSAYSAAELAALADVVLERDCFLIVDEIYAQLVYDGFEQRSLLEVKPELRDRLIIVDGVSKTFAMTGWRIGWMLGPAPVIAACKKLQSQSTSGPTACAQHAAAAALTGPQDCVETMRKEFEARRQIMVGGLDAIDGVSCRVPEGAFYAFANVEGLVGRSFNGERIKDDLELAAFLLEEARCAVVPGTAFGAPGHVRISYAASREQIEEGLRRIAEAVSRLK